MLVVSGLAIFTMALLSMVLTGKRTVNHQRDDYQLSSAVESTAILAAESLWSGYLADPAQGGRPGTIGSFRTYMDTLGVADSGTGGAPKASDGTDLLPLLSIPAGSKGTPQLNNVNVDSVQAVRRDVAGSTQLYITVSASTSRGQGIMNPVLDRAVQQVYTIEPENFSGFEYAMLTNNVNCIFCHTNVDSVDRYFNTDPAARNSFDRVRIGTLESLMIRHDADGNSSVVNDHDADSFIAGTLYTRGKVTDHDGVPTTNWPAQSFQAYAFDPANGAIREDPWGALLVQAFSPAGSPPGPMENLYEHYPTNFAAMPDGNMPLSFPPPIPDNGGIDPVTGQPDPAAVGNRQVDDAEFNLVANTALGSITAGVMTVMPPGAKITTAVEYQDAFFVGNTNSLQQSVQGNVVLAGSKSNPITIDGTLAIDGDLIIAGYVKGEGSIVVRGNVYMPTDLQYLDGREYVAGDPLGKPSGPRTFGIAPDSTRNRFGIAAGGNILVGDFLRPAALQPGGTWVLPGALDVVEGDMTGAWSFPLAEMSLFNRREWMKTQPMLPGAPGEAMLPSSQWTAVNPNYDANYVPRYYGHGPGDEIPIYNRGNIWFDTTAGTWRGDAEVPTYWDLTKIDVMDPNDPSDPYLFDVSGNPIAVTQTITPKDDWITDDLYKLGTFFFEYNRGVGPLQLDGLFYTNNSIFTLVSRSSQMGGSITVNGSLVAADIGMLAPGHPSSWSYTGPNRSPLSIYVIGLQLNYDARVRRLLNVKNPLQVTLKRTLWNPTSNVL